MRPGRMAVSLLGMLGGTGGIALVVMLGRGAVRLGCFFVVFGRFVVRFAGHVDSPVAIGSRRLSDDLSRPRAISMPVASGSESLTCNLETSLHLVPK